HTREGRHDRRPISLSSAISSREFSPWVFLLHFPALLPLVAALHRQTNPDEFDKIANMRCDARAPQIFPLATLLTTMTQTTPFDPFGARATFAAPGGATGIYRLAK